MDSPCREMNLEVGMALRNFISFIAFIECLKDLKSFHANGLHVRAVFAATLIDSRVNGDS
ncbi:MAG: hypothetical protein NTX52_04700 [Planctomycetota bacterium]|nr:hypothetical protein [Planctomycetota bacterium]